MPLLSVAVIRNLRDLLDYYRISRQHMPDGQGPYLGTQLLLLTTLPALEALV
jgi:hypothetical protein